MRFMKTLRGFTPVTETDWFAFSHQMLLKIGLQEGTKAIAALPALVVSPYTWSSKVAFSDLCHFLRREEFGTIQMCHALKMEIIPAAS